MLTGAGGEAVSKTYVETVGTRGGGFNLYDYLGMCVMVKNHGPKLASSATVAASTWAVPTVAAGTNVVTDATGTPASGNGLSMGHMLWPNV